MAPPDELATQNARRATIFRLPTGYRPQSARVFPSVGRSYNDGQEVAQARVDVQSDGQVVLEEDCETSSGGCSADVGYLTLDGITFRPSE